MDSLVSRFNRYTRRCATTLDAAYDQPQSACHFDAAGEDFISWGRAHGGPENPHGRERTERLQQPGQCGTMHLYRDNFPHTVENHLSGKCEAKEKPKPPM